MPPDSPVYRVKDWNESFEVAQSRKAGRRRRWVPFPLRQGSGYAELMSRDPTYSLYGAWTAIIRVAAESSEPGVLARGNGSPLGPKTIAVMTGGDPEVMAHAWHTFIEIGWLLACSQSTPSTVVVTPATEEIRGDEMRSEQDARPSRAASVSREVVDAIYAAYPHKREPRKAKAAIRAAVKRLPKETPLNGTLPGEWMLRNTEKLAAWEKVAQVRRAAGTFVPKLPYPVRWYGRGRYLEPLEEGPGAPKAETKDGTRRTGESGMRIFLHGQWRSPEQYETLTGKRLEAKR